MLHTTVLPSSTIPTWNQQLQGGLWKIASCACFAGINGIIRYLQGGSPSPIDITLPVCMIMFFQNLFATGFMVPVLLNHWKDLRRTQYPGLHLTRVVIAVTGISLWYLGLYYLPLAKAVALMFTGPIFTIIGAQIWLGEHIDRNRFMAISISFVGAFVILRPDEMLFATSNSGLGLAPLLPLMAAIAFAASKLCTRRLGRYGESPGSLTFYLLVLMVPVSLVPALIYWQTPSLQHLPWLILMGALATGAHYCLSKSLSIGEVSFVMPFGFSKLLLSALVGYIAFGEFSSSWSMWFGACIIFSSVLLLTRQPHSRPQPQPLLKKA
ncbi:MAG: DMT family transporter [Pseudomonadota bacterium]